MRLYGQGWLLNYILLKNQLAVLSSIVFFVHKIRGGHYGIGACCASESRQHIYFVALAAGVRVENITDALLV